jgi:hypothetical protein
MEAHLALCNSKVLYRVYVLVLHVPPGLHLLHLVCAHLQLAPVLGLVRIGLSDPQLQLTLALPLTRYLLRVNIHEQLNIFRIIESDFFLAYLIIWIL